MISMKRGENIMTTQRHGWWDMRLSVRQRSVLIGLITALSSQLYFSAWVEGFRISASAILYPVLLVTVMRESHRPYTGLVTGVFVTVFRILLDMTGGMGVWESLTLEYPGGIFYLCYDALLCFFLRDRRWVNSRRQWISFFLCDFLSNTINFLLSETFSGEMEAEHLVALCWIALGRSCAASLILWAAHSYYQLLLHEEHEHRYRRLFLMTADLKTELYFLRKDTEEVEQVMARAYRLYEQLKEEQVSEELQTLALSIARDVHEIKKDNLRIIGGLEHEVAQAYDHENMTLSDLLHILRHSTAQLLGSQRMDIRLECQCGKNLNLQEHYRLLSVLKNLVTNAVEAIQSDSGKGWIRVATWVEGEELVVIVEDDGPGIPKRSQKLLFEVGYSTKFNPETGNIGRGVGLPAVRYIVEELNGSIEVKSERGEGTQFHLRFPLKQVTGG